MFKIKHTVEIDASVNLVFQVVSEIENYHRWNPWNIHCTNGPAKPGTTTEVTAVMGGKTMKLQHRILEVIPDEQFKWCDTGWFTIFAYGERARYVEEKDEGCHYRVELVVTGPLSFVAEKLYGEEINRCMRQETIALKEYCESMNDSMKSIGK